MPTPPSTAQRSSPLKRELGWYASFAIAFGFVSIATGIFTTYGSILQSSGPRGIWAWPIAAAGQALVALVLGALAARIPLTGYAYQWVSRIASPLWGWLMGWVSFAFLVVVVAAVDYTIAATIFPELFGYAPTTGNCWLVTAVVMLLQAILVALSTTVANRTNQIAVSIQITGMIGITVLLFIVGAIGGRLDFSNLFITAPISPTGYWEFGGLTEAGPFPMAFLLGAFTIVGFESAANLTEETKDPESTIPRAMVQAVVGLGILGFLFLVAVTALAGDTAELAQSATPIAAVITSVLGPVVGRILLVLVVISIFSCGLVITMSGTRLIWAMSRDQRFPGWQVLRRIDSRLETPLSATIFYFIVAQALLAVFAGSDDALFILFSAATLLPALIYAGTVLMYAIKRKSLPPSRGFDLRGWELPVLVLAGSWLVYELLIFRDASFAKPWIYVGGMVAIGLLYLGYLLLTRGRAGLTMPNMTDIDRTLDQETRA